MDSPLHIKVNNALNDILGDPGVYEDWYEQRPDWMLVEEQLLDALPNIPKFEVLDEYVILRDAHIEWQEARGIL